MGLKNLINRVRAAPHDVEARRRAVSLIEAYLRFHMGRKDAKSYALTEEIADAAPEMQIRILFVTAKEINSRRNSPYSITGDWNKKRKKLTCLAALFNHLARKKLPLQAPQLNALIVAVASSKYDMPAAGVIARVQDHLAQQPMTVDMVKNLETLRARLAKRTDQNARRLAARVDAILEPTPTLIDPEDAWAELALSDLEQMSREQRLAWGKLIEHAVAATSSKPTSKWERTAEDLVAEIGLKTFKRLTAHWFGAIGRPGTAWHISKIGAGDNRVELTPRNADIIRGFAWCYAFMEDPACADTIAGLASASFKKVPGVGSLSTQIGNACLYALSQMPGAYGVAHLSQLKMNARAPSVRKATEKALATAADGVGMSSADVEEIATPTHGLDAEAMLCQGFGDYTAQLAIKGSGTQLTWWNPDGRSQKTAPAFVKRDYAGELRHLRGIARDVKNTLITVRDRLERLPMVEQTWPFSTWQERYLRHPIVASLSKRLIWEFRYGEQSSQACWFEDGLVDLEQQLVPVERSNVRLWHPVGEAVETVRRWREWLERNEVTQPFKQAYREAYVPTDEERDAESIERFRGHVLKQFQFNTLAQQRGWKTGMIGNFDSENRPTLEIPQHEMAAELTLEWFDAAENEGPTGVLKKVRCEQIRFLDPSGRPVSIGQVPPVVFSEVLRDVELFVSEASIGNDADRHGKDAFYAPDAALGPLSSAAQVRKDVIERVMLRLKLKRRCKVQDRFLMVRGKKRHYRIHLGSGAILMEPSDRRLEVTPSTHQKTRAERITLPFEDDPMLTDILAMTFMLMDDTKIKNPEVQALIRSA